MNEYKPNGNYIRKLAYSVMLGVALASTPNISYSADSGNSMMDRARRSMQEAAEKAKKANEGDIEGIIKTWVGGVAKGLIAAIVGVKEGIIGTKDAPTPAYQEAKDTFAKYFSAEGRRKAIVKDQFEAYTAIRTDALELVEELRKEGIEIDTDSETTYTSPQATPAKPKVNTPKASTPVKATPKKKTNTKPSEPSGNGGW